MMNRYKSRSVKRWYTVEKPGTVVETTTRLLGADALGMVPLNGSIEQASVLLGYSLTPAIDSWPLPDSVVDAYWASSKADRESILASVYLASPPVRKLVAEMGKHSIKLGGTASTDWRVPAWLLLRNRVYHESRFRPDARNTNSGADGPTQIVKTTRKLFVKKYADQFPWLSYSGSLTDKNGVALSNAIDLAALMFIDTIGSVRRHGIPPLVKEQAGNLPLLVQALISMSYYYHNGSLPTPYWVRVKGEDHPNAVYQVKALKREIADLSKAYSNALQGQGRPLVS